MTSAAEMIKIKRRTILAVSATALFVVAYFPIFQVLFKKWAGTDEYTHVFFTAPVIVYMVWKKRTLITASSSRYLSTGLLLVIVSILFYLVSLQLQVPTITAVAMVMTVVSASVYLFGFRVIKQMAVPIIYLMIIIPIPGAVLSVVTLPLQLKVSQVSEYVIRLFGVPIMRQGNVIHIPDKTFQVVEACSGIHSIIMIITLSLILADLTLKKSLFKLLLVISGIPVAIFVNIIRVVVMVLAFHFFRLDITTGTAHTILGTAVFGITLAVLFVTQKVLENWQGK